MQVEEVVPQHLADDLYDMLFPRSLIVFEIVLEWERMHAEEFRAQVENLGVEISDIEIPPVSETIVTDFSAEVNVSISKLKSKEKVRYQDEVRKHFNSRNLREAADKVLRESQEKLEKLLVRQQTRLFQALDRVRQEGFGLRFYIWRTQDDNRVRSSHAENDDRVFRWNERPETGHPGEDWGCRCRAEPILDEDGVRALDVPIERVFPIESLIGLGAGAIVKPVAGRLLSRVGAARLGVGKISRTSLNGQQLRNLNRFERKLPKAAKETEIIKQPNGDVVFRADVPARNIPNSFSRYEKTVDSSGNTVSYTKTTFAPDGSIVHTKVK